MLGDHEGASGLDFGDGIADRGVIRNRFPIGLAVAAGGLRAALDDVAGHHPAGQFVPIVEAPAELVDGRPKRKRGIGAASGDHDPRSFGERGGDWRGAQVYIGAAHARADGGERLPGVEVAQFDPAGHQIVEGIENIVAGHDADGDLPAVAGSNQSSSDGLVASRGIDAARVGNYLDPAADDFGGAGFDDVDKIAGIAGLGISLALLLKNRKSDFGQVIERQVIDRAAAHLLQGRLGRIAPKALPVGYANHGRSPPVSAIASSAASVRSLATQSGRTPPWANSASP